MTCDRNDSGDVDFHPAFRSVDTVPLLGGDVTDVLVVVDGCVLEIYLNGGLTTLTQLVFPRKPLTHITAT